MPECYIRGSTIKYLRIPDEVIDMVKEETAIKNRGRDNKGGKSQRGRPATRGLTYQSFKNCILSLFLLQAILVDVVENLVEILDEI